MAETDQKSDQTDHAQDHATHTRREEFRVSGEDLLKKVKDLIAQGNVRRIIIKSKDGKTLIEVPLTVGAVGVTALAVFAPVLAAVGAIAALVTECSVIVERDDTPAK
jgi:hypothetical protein